MDAKANTHVCPSPFGHSEFDKKACSASFRPTCSSSPAEYPARWCELNEHGHAPGPVCGQLVSDQRYHGVTRSHATISSTRWGSVQIRDEGSTNGTFVNGKRIHAHRLVELADGDRVQLGTSVVLKLVRLDPSDEQFQREMFERTVRDTLTGLYNRAYLLNQIGVLAERSAVQEIGLAVLMLDIDHFKQINDRYGHLAGDGVLRQVAAVIRESTRAEDLVARFGGEEFVVVLPVSVPDLASRTRRAHSGESRRAAIFAEGNEIRVTASIGLALRRPGPSRNAMALIMTADEALYRAKADGRNRVVFGAPRCAMAPQTDRVSRVRRHLFTDPRPPAVAGQRSGCVLEKPLRSGYDQPDSVHRAAERWNDRSNERRGRPCRNLSRKRLITCCHRLHWACVAGAFRSRASASSRGFSSSLGINVVQIACGDPHHASWDEGDGMPAAALAVGNRHDRRHAGLSRRRLHDAADDQGDGRLRQPCPARPSGSSGSNGPSIARWRWALTDLTLHAGFLPAPATPIGPRFSTPWPKRATRRGQGRSRSLSRPDRRPPTCSA